MSKISRIQQAFLEGAKWVKYLELGEWLKIF